MRVWLPALLLALLAAAPAHATLYEISGRAGGERPSKKKPATATDVHLRAQLLTAQSDGSLAAVTGWIDSLVGIDASGVARALPAARQLLEDPVDIVPAPGGGVLVSNEEVVQRVAADGSRSILLERQCAGEVCATPWGLAPQPDGGLLIADTFNHRVLRRSPDGSLSTVLAEPLHWPFALGLLPGGGYMVAEGKPGHGVVDRGLRVWRVDPGAAPRVIAGGGTIRAPGVCGGSADTPPALDLRHVVDAVTLPSGAVVIADRIAGLLQVEPDGSWGVIACPAPKLAVFGGDLRPAGLDFAQVRMNVRHLAVGPDGTLYVVDDHGRVYADLGPGAARLAVALAPASVADARSGQVHVAVTRGAAVAVRDGRRVLARAALPPGQSTLRIPRLGAGVRTLRVTARSGDAIATHALRVFGRSRLPRDYATKLLRRELRRASRFGLAPRLRACRLSARSLRCGRATLTLRADGELEVRRGSRRWLAAP